MDLSEELVKDFLSEAFELVSSLEESLLVLEKEPENQKSINEIFRSVHTIKGGAATVGFSEIKDFTHLFEDVMDMVRKKNLAITSEYISNFLEAKDEIEKMLVEREKGNVYSSDRQLKLIEFFKYLKGEKSPSGMVSSSTKTSKLSTELIKSKLTNFEIENIHELIEKGKKVYVLCYDFNEQYEMKDVAPFQVYALLNDIGEIIKMEPTLNYLESVFAKEVCFVFATEKSEKEIMDKTFLTEMLNKIDILLLTKEMLDGFSVSNLQKPLDSSPQKEQKDVEETKRATSTIRVESWKVDELLNLMGELVITKASLSQIYDKMGKAEVVLKNILKPFLSGVLKLNLDNDEKIKLEKNAILLDSFIEMFQVFDDYRETVQKLSRISSSLQENVMNLRMVPIQTVFSRFPRLVRDMAEKMKKDVELLIEGVETEIDKSMVDDIFDPLIHIIRNSLDHGIEPTEERLKLGKPAKGRIVLKAYHEGDSIVIEAMDDGRGVDFDALRKKAIDSRIFPREVVEKMTQKELLALIFLPGFSTAKQVTEISGRGVGMDVVKKKIEEMGGNVGFYTAKNKGSRIVVRLPLTLAIIQGLLVVVNEIHYFVPIASIEETIVVSKNDFKDINGKKMIFLRENLVPVIFLEEFFYHKKISIEEIEKNYCIVVKSKDKNFGLIVNNVIGEQDIVIKPLNNRLVKTYGISAATIIGNGDIAFIIDVERVITHSE
ncbi:MAG: chemotaxis protein CheA [Brevinematales bacterium]|nr:chemotaxis protein CheA [Brevinematales bacterium]